MYGELVPPLRWWHCLIISLGTTAIRHHLRKEHEHRSHSYADGGESDLNVGLEEKDVDEEAELRRGPEQDSRSMRCFLRVFVQFGGCECSHESRTPATLNSEFLNVASILLLLLRYIHIIIPGHQDIRTWPGTIQKSQNQKRSNLF